MLHQLLMLPPCIGCVWNCAVSIADIPMLMTTHDQGELNVRFRALVATIGRPLNVESFTALLDQMEECR